MSSQAERATFEVEREVAKSFGILCTAPCESVIDLFYNFIMLLNRGFVFQRFLSNIRFRYTREIFPKLTDLLSVEMYIL